MALPLDYNVNAFTKGVNGFGRKPPVQGYVYSITIAASTEKNFTVPSTSAMGAINSSNTPSFLAIFSYKPATEFWIAINATAAVPTGSSWATDTAELNPSAYIVKAGDTISAISASGGDISVALYSVPDA
jgi:hypothetical protein